MTPAGVGEGQQHQGDGSPPLVSVVVPTRNRARVLRKLLHALHVQDYPRYEIIVVDDASTDDTPELLASWSGPGQIALRMDRPSGSYAARNRGWRVARGHLVAFTDDDCVPAGGWLSALVAALIGDNLIGIQGVTLAEPGEITPFTHQIDQRHPGPPYRTCNIAYRRSILERLGGFDDSFRWYGDNILGLQALQLGRIGFAPDAVVLHPPRARVWRGKQEWLARFVADIAHRRELQRLRVEPAFAPRTMLPLVLWVLRPLAKQGLTHIRYFLRHPARYVHDVVPMAREKRDLLRALITFWFRGDTLSSAGHGGGVEPLVSVVVVTRNRPHLLDDALAALEQQTWTRREVIVVDHDEHRSAEDITRRRRTRYVSHPSGTLGTVRQAGLEVARGEMIAFTDDDCLAQPGWLEALVDVLNSRPGIDGVQGVTRAEAGSIGTHAVRINRPNRLYQTCNMAYRRSALTAAGGFDPQFHGWFEDTALAACVLERGEIAFAPGAVVVHRAMPRRWLDRAAWHALLADERHLACYYRSFYRRTRGPGFWPTVCARWLIGSPLKTAARDLPGATSDLPAYVELLRSLIHERKELVLALTDLVRNRESV